MRPSSVSLRLLGALALLGLSPAASAAPAPLSPRPLPDKSARSALPRELPVERLVVKFHEGSHVRLRDGGLVSRASERSSAERSLLAERGLSDVRLARDLRSAQALMDRAPRTGVPRRLFTEAESELDARKGQGEARERRQLADLNLYYEVPLLPGTSAGELDALVAALNALESVEQAYVQPAAEPAMVGFGTDAALSGLLAAAQPASTTPLFVDSQGYLEAAPLGVDARHAWTVPGGTGVGVRFVDIEGGWRTSHEDMPGLFTQLGTQINDLAWRNHGTAVLGEVAGVANGYGVTGIAYSASVGTSGIGSQSAASAISNAAGVVGTGGVILIGLQAPGPADSTPCDCNVARCNSIAMEYWSAEYDAIAMATALGVTVVEAAGDGSANLDDAAYGGRFNRQTRDSGALLVGASTPITRAPMCWTNFGSRVDLHGWGEYVGTLGYGDMFDAGEDRFYTSSFSGTSSAAPIVSGAAIALQGASLARNGTPLTPRSIRAMLATTGTAQAADTRKIGPLPNLRQALAQLEVLRNGMLLSDTDSSLAVAPYNGAYDGMPLMLVRGCTQANPNCTWIFHKGMIINGGNTDLAVTIGGGGAQSTPLTLSSACTPSDPACTWTYKNGVFVSDKFPTMGINAYGGAAEGTVLRLYPNCPASNTDCTWTYRNFRLVSDQSSTLWVNAYGGALSGNELRLNTGCSSSNGDCTWTLTRGLLLSDRNPAMAVNAFNGAQEGTVLRMNGTCTPYNSDCTWTLRNGMLLSDTDPSLAINAWGGAQNLTVLKLTRQCTVGNKDCTWTFMPASY